MQVTKSQLKLTKVKLTVLADESDMAPIKSHVLSHFKHRVKVPGFRAGTAPPNLIEKHINQKALIDDFIDHALNQFYRQAVSQEQLRPVDRPHVTIKKFVPFTDMEFDAEVEVLGPIKLPDYKKIRLNKKSVTIDEKEIAETIEAIRTRAAQRQAVERAAKNGDEVIIDFKGKDKAGKPISGAEGNDYPLILGSQSFIPGFEQNVAGLKTGDKKDFEVVFPDNYAERSLQGQNVNFQVAVKKVQELVLPKLDNKFAAQAGPFKTVAEFKADVKNYLKSEKERQARQEQENELVTRLAQQSILEIPENLVDEQISKMEEDEKRNLVYRGQTWQEHLEAEGITEEQHRDRHRPEAEQKVKAGIVLGEIARLEGIEVSKEELDAYVSKLKEQYQDQAMRAELDKPESRRELEYRLGTEKTIERLLHFAIR